jgi:hypothetical protein
MRNPFAIWKTDQGLLPCTQFAPRKENLPQKTKIPKTPPGVGPPSPHSPPLDQALHQFRRTTKSLNCVHQLGLEAIIFKTKSRL